MSTQVTLYIRRDPGVGKFEKIRHGLNPQIATGRESYYMMWYDAGKRVYKNLGNDLGAANKAAVAKASELLLGTIPTEDPKPSPEVRRSLEELRVAFVTNKRMSRKKTGEMRDEDTLRAYEDWTREFLDAIKVKQPGQITKEILTAWKDSLYERPRRGGGFIAHNTVCNIYSSITTFLLYCGIDHKHLIAEDERPTQTEEEPEAYSQAELTQFFAGTMIERDRLYFTFLLRTGAREKEGSHLEWSNLNLGPNPTVTFRNQGGFKTKTRKFRTVPLEPRLAAELRAWQGKMGDRKYVFGTKRDQVEGHFLRCCKEIAERAGLNPEECWLHKFRDTALTSWLRGGVDLRTCQQWAGHSSILMTERYLAPQESGAQQGLMIKAWEEQPQAAHASATS